MLGTPDVLWTQSAGWSRGLFGTCTKYNPETLFACGRKQQGLVEADVGFHW